MNPLEIEKIDSDSTKLKTNELIEKGVIPPIGYSTAFVGSTGSGKSTLLINMVRKFYKDIFEPRNIYLASPVAEEDDMVRQIGLNKKNYITKEVIKKLETLVRKRKEEIKKAGGTQNTEPVLIILEDATSDRNLMKSKVYITLATASRHLNITTFVCIHNFRTLKPVIRNNIMNWYIFQQNPKEVFKIEEEMNLGMPKKDFLKMFYYCVNEPYSFLTIYRKKPFKERFRKRLDTILELKDFGY